MKAFKSVLLILCVGVISLCNSLIAQTPVEKGLKSINKEYAQEYITTLAGDSLNGRRVGTVYAKKSAQYIANQLKNMGVEPFSPAYYNDYKVKFRRRLPKSATNDKSVDTFLVVRNVLGVLRGANPNKFVVIGAHYDHIGSRKAQGNEDVVFNGADDNASGVAGVLQVARAFMSSGVKPNYSIIFAFWDGEESGLLGSNFFVDSSAYIKNIKAYVNLDMIGRDDMRLGKNSVEFSFFEANEHFANQLKNDVATYGVSVNIRYKKTKSAMYNSDYAPFAIKKVPAVWFTTGLHPNYHKVSDEADKINWNKTVEVTKAAFLMLWYLANDAAL